MDVCRHAIKGIGYMHSKAQTPQAGKVAAQACYHIDIFHRPQYSSPIRLQLCQGTRKRHKFTARKLHKLPTITEADQHKDLARGPLVAWVHPDTGVYIDCLTGRKPVAVALPPIGTCPARKQGCCHISTATITSVPSA